MVAGFIPVHVLADEAGHVRHVFFFPRRNGREQGVQAFDQLFAGAEEADQAGKIVRGQEGILPGIPFAVVVPVMVYRKRIEGRPPAPVGEQRPHEAGRCILIPAPGMGAVPHFGPEFVITQEIGGSGRRGVGNGIFHVFCHRIRGPVGGNIAIFFPQVLCPVILLYRQAAGAESFFRIDSGNFFDNRVRYGNHARIAYHAVRLVAHQVPDRKPALFLENLHHRIDEIGPALRLDDVVQGHGGPIGIP